MFARIRVALVLLVVAAAEPAWSDLYTVGVGAGCTHATVQAAVDAAALTAETDTILVARNTTYSSQAISIENQSLTVIGGVATCTNFLPDGRTTLSGAGSPAAPVISVRGSGNVSISRINLTGGDNPGTLDSGGGLFFRGSGVVRLDDMNITNNQGGTGAGIYAQGTSDTAQLDVGANVLISNNTAAVSGGGIAAEDIRLTMTSPDSAVFLNTAVGYDDPPLGFLGGHGGGIYCEDCQAEIATATAFGTLFLNIAYGRGGGLAVVASGRDTTALLYTKTATKPLVIYGNQAGFRGGAVYVQSNFDSLPPDFNHSQVFAWDIIVRQNTAPEGAAVFLKGSDEFNGWAESRFIMGEGRRGVACGAANGPCNRITGNVAQDLEGVATNGAILEDATRDTTFRLFHTIIDDNVGRSVLDKSAYQSVTELKRCLLTGNTVSEELIQNRGDSSLLVVDHSTIAGNAIGGTHVILADRDVRMGHSIVWQPGKKVLRRQNSGGTLTVANLLVNDIDGLPPQVDISSTTNPGFMSAATGDYHLRPDSIAVDFAQYAFDPSLDIAYDLDWGATEVDLPEVPNEFGPRDLGAYEMPEIPDLIFKDGFETGNLGAWASAASDGGDLSAAQVSAMDGTWGLRGIVDDAAGLYVQDDAPWSEPRYRARFYFDTNGFDPGETAGTRRTRILLAFAEAPQRRVLALVLRRIGGQYSLMARARLDDNSQADTNFYSIADGAHYVEVHWGRATGPNANDGWLHMWIDGGLVVSMYGLDNSVAVVDFVRLGALSVKQSASGTLHWDAFESRRQSYIGPVP